MDGFYTTPIKILRPVEIAAPHGRATTLTYEVSEGAQLIDVDNPVELQPAARVELDDDMRIATQSGYEMQTQPGVNIDLRPYDRVRTSIGDLDVVGEVKRWPGTEFESGVDHVEVILELRTG
ncbi:hypothetical protein [Gordonia sp. SND2]|uniref:hypothetical protein n=1 Tax=Gordonia sp. SND2 TaxID=3388659 RepID=UPI00398B7FB1